MPTYVYRCTACGHEFEQFQKMSDDPLTVCPVCGSEIRRVIYPVGVVFKGSGWYITDSRKRDSEVLAGHANGKAKTADHEDKTPAAATSETKSDAGTGDKTDKADKTTKAAAD